jgi:hypothetical protein
MVATPLDSSPVESFPVVLLLRRLRDPKAPARVLELVRRAGGSVVTLTGTGGRDHRVARHLVSKLEPLGIEATWDRRLDDVVVLKLSDGALPGYTAGTSEVRDWTPAEQQATRARCSYTNFVHLANWTDSN